MSEILELKREVSELREMLVKVLSVSKIQRNRWLQRKEFRALTGLTDDQLDKLVAKDEYRHLKRHRVGVGNQYDYQTWKQLFQ